MAVVLRTNYCLSSCFYDRQKRLRKFAGMFDPRLDYGPCNDLPGGRR